MKLDKKKKISIYIVSSLIVVAMFGIILVKVYNPGTEKFFIPCMFYKLTGIKCPGCGMTRAIHNLVNGNIKQAMWYNLMLIPLILMLIYAGYRYIKYLVKDEEIINKRMERVLVIFLIFLLTFGVTRNLTTLFY